jgi:hypothetical protein
LAERHAVDRRAHQIGRVMSARVTLGAGLHRPFAADQRVGPLAQHRRHLRIAQQLVIQRQQRHSPRPSWGRAVQMATLLYEQIKEARAGSTKNAESPNVTYKR